MIKRRMLDLFDELSALIRAFDGRGIDYALCGGLALAVYGLPRATVDIDVLVPPEGLSRLKQVAAGRGFDIEARPMRFAAGAVEIHRMSKVDPDPGDLLSLDAVLVTPELTTVWAGRRRVEWEGGELTVVSRAGLIAMKRLRGSGQDRDDIASLEDSSDEC